MRGLIPNFHINVYVSDLYIPRSTPHIRSHTHECGNWDRGRAIPFLGLFVSNLRYCVFELQCGFKHGQDMSVSSALVEEMTLVKSLHNGDPDVIQSQGLASA